MDMQRVWGESERALRLTGLGVLALASCAAIVLAVVHWQWELRGEEGIAGTFVEMVDALSGSIDASDGVDVVVGALWSMAFLALPAIGLFAFLAAAPLLFARATGSVMPVLRVMPATVMAIVATLLAVIANSDAIWVRLRSEEWEGVPSDSASWADAAGVAMLSFLFFLVIAVQTVSAFTAKAIVPPASGVRVDGARSGVLFVTMVALQVVLLGGIASMDMPWPLAAACWLVPAVLLTLRRAMWNSNA